MRALSFTHRYTGIKCLLDVILEAQITFSIILVVAHCIIIRAYQRDTKRGKIELPKICAQKNFELVTSFSWLRLSSLCHVLILYL